MKRCCPYQIPYCFTKYARQTHELTNNPDNVEIINDSSPATEQENLHKIYVLEHPCYKCKKNTSILTYIIFDDETNDDVIFPWNKERLSENQDIFSHLIDPSIEYYGIKIIGDDKKLDQTLVTKFPQKIKVLYSKTQKRRYAMNICKHCGSQQGAYFIYRHINEIIADMKPLDEFCKI